MESSPSSQHPTEKHSHRRVRDDHDGRSNSNHWKHHQDRGGDARNPRRSHHHSSSSHPHHRREDRRENRREDRRSEPHAQDVSASNHYRRRGYQDIAPSQNNQDSKRFRRGEAGPKEKDPFPNHDWKCSQCGCWNYPNESRCHRCERDYKDNERHSRERSDVEDNRRRENLSDREGDNHSGSNDEELDEFGRLKKKAPPKPVKQQREWPPSFEKNGGAFVLDARSGMFYEAESDFFYDPKTKYYYSNRRATYYTYDSERTPPFEPVKAGEGESSPTSSACAIPPHSAGMDQEPLLAGTSKLSSRTSSSCIAIRLKTKKLPKSSSSRKKEKESSTTSSTTVSDASVGNGADGGTASRLERQHQADMDKWSQVQNQARQDNESSTTTTTNDTKVATVARTVKGEPICTLCRRKFATIEKLQYHERVSQLHKDNLKKQQEQKMAEAKAFESEGGSTTYVDRAQKRRALYGEENVVGATVTSHENHLSQNQPQTDSMTTTAETLDSSTNVGNKMLQKMGWKAGDRIGRQQHHGEAGEHGQKPLMVDELKKDWDRIESMAAAGGGRLG